MCRLVGWVSAEPTTLAAILGPEALDRLAHLSTVHCDGWGAAWHDDAGGLQVRRSLRPAHEDEAFRDLAENLRTRSAIVHLRLGTPGYGEGADNTHPFVAGPQAFAHNGAIGPRARIDRLLRDGDGSRVRGRTDSERYFLALREEMADGADLAEAVRRVLQRMEKSGLVGNSLNALLLDPQALHVIAEHDAHWEPSTIPVWPADDLASGLALPRYLTLSYRVRPDEVVAVSSGIVSETQEWAPLPSHTVLTVGLETRELQLAPVMTSPMAGAALVAEPARD
jgi:predicted glutamine amidotransferase